MVSKTDERAFERLIERVLAGTNSEELEGDENAGYESNFNLYGEGHGYRIRHSRFFDKQFVVDWDLFWRFLENTQPEQLDKLRDRTDWKKLVLERFNRKLQTTGFIKLLKDGLKVDNVHLTLFFRQPYHDLNPELSEKFEQNIFSVTRQLFYSKTNPGRSVDMVIFLNGLPIITMELKNRGKGETGETVYNAQEQYKNRRDPKEPLFQFARCLVHFAVDTEEVYMTTKLAGKDTTFLPFNKGDNFGKGNPVNPAGHKTAYLWEEILSRKSLSNIIEHYIILSGKKKRDPIRNKTLFFPRYHQLEVVRNLLQDAEENGVGQTYLIQHSAGSGKSNSITWAAYQLIELYPLSESTPGARGLDTPLFDSVIVVTDRRVLDRQLRDNFTQFSEVKNIFAPASSSQELKQNLESGKKIITTTIQKFKFIIDGIEDLSEKRFAVIIDEAHSSQSGESADHLNRSLGELKEEDEVQDAILEAMKRRKLRKNASYFAFTATPKNSTLERFGTEMPDGKFVPFHLYSMKQAIEENFILDVLANYTTYRSYYQIRKSVEENPEFNEKKAQKKLRTYVESHKQTIEIKAEDMVKHFMRQVVAAKRLKGRGKAMVITRNIEAAIRYYQAIKRELKKAGAGFKPIIAFSGKKELDGIEHTEESLNGFSGQKIEEKFDSDEFRILVVANKFLTGFDQPKLCTMYVDKKLQGVLVVQALSRLNRCNHKLNKQTSDVFVLDFFNTAEEVKKGFDPFYTATSLSEATDINVLHDLKDEMDEVGVYEWVEVETFNQLYFANAKAEKLDPIIDQSAHRFNKELELEEEEKADFKIKAKQFVKIYAQMASIIDFNILAWEKLYWFLKFLIPKLKVKNPDQEEMDELLNSVDLNSYGLERTQLQKAITLNDEESELKPQNANPRSVHEEEEEHDRLDQIVRTFNERWFEGWDETPETQRVRFWSVVNEVRKNNSFQKQFLDNQDEQNRNIAVEKMILEAMNKVRSKEISLFKQYATNDEFKRSFNQRIVQILSDPDLSSQLQREFSS